MSHKSQNTAIFTAMIITVNNTGQNQEKEKVFGLKSIRNLADASSVTLLMESPRSVSFLQHQIVTFVFLSMKLLEYGAGWNLGKEPTKLFFSLQNE